MSAAPGNTSNNAPQADDKNGGGKAREYVERTREMAPPEAIGTFRRTFQSSFISTFTGKPCQLQPVEHNVRPVAPEQSVAATLQTHPKVQMHPLLQRNAMSQGNGSKNSLLDMLAKKHNDAVQRAMEEDEERVSKQEEPEKVQAFAGGTEEAGASGGNHPNDDIQQVQKSDDEAGIQKTEEEEAPSVSKSSVVAATNPNVQREISPTGEAPKDTLPTPAEAGTLRNKDDPNLVNQKAGSEGAQSGSALQKTEEQAPESVSKSDDEATRDSVSPKNQYIQASGDGQQGTTALQSELNSSKGKGNPLPEGERNFFESRMGADFSGVRIHTGAQAEQMNQGLGAHAFAHGGDIYFNSGKYQPGTSQGRHLLAHELTHTVQQGGASLLKSEKRESESEGNAIQRMGEVRASPKVGQRLCLTPGVQKTEDEQAAPKVQAKCSTCAAEEASLQKSEDENAAPKIQAKCATCAAEDAAVQKSEDDSIAPQISPISRTSNSHSALNLQRMLKIGQPGDKYEQEADATADRVMRTTDEQLAPSRQENETISSQTEEADPKLQREADESLSPKIQRTEEESASPMIQKEEEMDPELAKQLEEADQAQVNAIDPGPAQAAAIKAQQPNEELLQGPESMASGELEAANAEAEAEGKEGKEGEVEGMEGEGDAKGKGKKGKKGAAGKESEDLGPIGKQLEETSAEVCPSAEAKTQQLAQNETTHDNAEDKLGQTESAVEPPAEEGQAMGNATQVEEVDGKPEPNVSEEAAKQELDSAISDSVPNDIEGLNKFKSQGKAAVVGSRVMETVNKDVDAVKGTYNEMGNTATPAPPSNVPQALPETEVAPETPAMNNGENAVPIPTAEQTDMTKFDNESEDIKKKEGISQEQLDMVDSGDLAEANQEDKKLKKQVKDAPAEIKDKAKEDAAKVEKDAKKDEEKTRGEMREKRDGALKNTKGKQEKTKTELEKKREAVTQKINGMYEKAKKSVTDKLNNLETVNKVAFDIGQKAASKTFEDEVNADINRWKKKRYSGVFGGVKWLKDKFFGIADFPEVQAAFDNARARYIKRIDQLIKTINDANKKVIAGCKEELANAKLEIKKYVDGLGPELKAAGKAAQADMAKKLEELDGFINKKQKELTEKLCKAKDQAIKDIDKKIEKMKSEMSGLLAKLGALLLQALKKFFEWALKAVGKDPTALLNILDKGAAVIGALFKNPIGFLGNMVGAVRKGIDQFQANIKQHLINGLVGWLTGSMSEVAITLPSTWDLKGILHFILQLLGLTWQNLRAKLVKRVGEKPVAMAETGVDIVKRVVTEGPIGLWEWVKEKAGEIKEQVFGGIRNWIISNMVKKGIIKLVSMLNPAGAIVQAIIAIFDTVMFFVENWQSILDMVNSIFDSVANIAAGKIGAAATFIENAMAKTIPLILNFLGRFIGLSGIGKAVQNTVKAIRKPVDNAMDKALDFMEKQVRKLFGKKTGKGEEKKDGKYTDADRKKALAAIPVEEKKQANDGQVSDEESKKTASSLKSKHPVFKELTPTLANNTYDYKYIFRTPLSGVVHTTLPAVSQGEAKKKIEQWTKSAHDTTRPSLVRRVDTLSKEIMANPTEENFRQKAIARGDIKSSHQEPMGDSTKFGKAIFNKAQLRLKKAAKTAHATISDKSSERAKKVALVDKDKDHREKFLLSHRAPKIHAGVGIYANPLKELRDTIFKKSNETNALNQLEAAFVLALKEGGAPEHDAFAPIITAGYPKLNTPTPGKATLHYTYAGGSEQFTVVYDMATSTPDNIKGEKIGFHNLGRGKTEGATFAGHDRAHLIANEIRGSGYIRGLNLVTTSTPYNQETMRNKEGDIAVKINKAGKVANFDLNVSVTWATPTNDVPIASVRAALTARHAVVAGKTGPKNTAEAGTLAALLAMSDSALDAALKAKQATLPNRRVMRIDYFVDNIILQDGSTSALTVTDFTGPDNLFGS